jgi:methionyl-tRNA formyltransferase
MTANQAILTGFLEKLQKIESGKNYGPIAELDELGTLSAELSEFARELLRNKLQELAEDILATCPSVSTVCDAQGANFIKNLKGENLPLDQFKTYYHLLCIYEHIYNSYSGTFAYRKD